MEYSKLNIDSQTFGGLLMKGDTATFETLFRLYYDKLIYIARNYLIYQEDAEEVIQSVFLKLWENRKKLKTISNINNYIYTITKNACLDVIKHQKVKFDYINSDLHKKAGIHYQFINDEAASLLVVNELEQKIKVSLELLPKKSKEVFIMSRVDGLKHNEIAKELNISPKTVNNHISKAIKHMKLHLRDYLYLFL
ncbi:MAG: RNA polymerase sigma-70 factor [Bacteroidota bacterium]